MIRPAILITPESFPQIYARVHRMMLEIKNAYFSDAPFTETTIYARFLEILVLVSGAAMRKIHSSALMPEMPSRKNIWINFLQSAIILTSILQKILRWRRSLLAGFSKYHFTRLFRQYADTSFYKYLNQRRIDHAKTLLLDPSLSVIEVALASGFSSLSAFLRMFKLLNHCTPTEYRSMYRDSDG